MPKKQYVTCDECGKRHEANYSHEETRWNGTRHEETGRGAGRARLTSPVGAGTLPGRHAESARTDPTRTTQEEPPMTVRITGLDDATRIPAGATLRRAYWTVPSIYNPGPEYDTQEKAIAAAIAAKEAELAKADEQVAQGLRHGPHLIPETLTVDLRWDLAWPPPGQGGSSGVDMTVSRTRYDTLDEAREHLARIRRFALA